MSANKIVLENKPKKHRPLGIWILTIFAMIFGGVIPLSFEPLDLLRGYTAFFSERDIPIITVRAFLSLFIVVTSILAWSGSKIGKIIFLIFVTVFFLGDGIDTYSWGTRIPSSTLVWFRYITDFTFPLICIWYFNRPSIKEFFRKE
jgi:hypothetical protein